MSKTFQELDQRVKEIAYDLMAQADNANHLTRLLDSDPEFRDATGCLNEDVLPTEVDKIVRFYKKENKHG